MRPDNVDMIPYFEGELNQTRRIAEAALDKAEALANVIQILEYQAASWNQTTILTCELDKLVFDSERDRAVFHSALYRATNTLNERTPDELPTT